MRPSRDAEPREKIGKQKKRLQKIRWLLDPGWERATGSERMEQNLRKEFPKEFGELADAEKLARYDIKYRTNGGEHILVEMKRASRVLEVLELVAQGRRYKTALEHCLKKASPSENYHISIVFVIGTPVKEDADKEFVKGLLRTINARIVYYEELIQGALNSYEEYLRASADVDNIKTLIEQL